MGVPDLRACTASIILPIVLFGLLGSAYAEYSFTYPARVMTDRITVGVPARPYPALQWRATPCATDVNRSARQQPWRRIGAVGAELVGGTGCSFVSMLIAWFPFMMEGDQWRPHDIYVTQVVGNAFLTGTGTWLLSRAFGEKRRWWRPVCGAGIGAAIGGIGVLTLAAMGYSGPDCEHAWTVISLAAPVLCGVVLLNLR